MRFSNHYATLSLMAAAIFAGQAQSWHAIRPLASLSALSLPQPRPQRSWHVTLLKLRVMLLVQLSLWLPSREEIVELKREKANQIKGCMDGQYM
jgi:cyanate permease